MDIEVRGTKRLDEVAKLLKQQGTAGQGLRKSLNESIRITAKPLGRFVAVDAGRHLPRRGGLGYRVAGAGGSIRSRFGSSGVSVRLNLRARKYDLAAMDRGRLRHPVFGNRENWVLQSIPAKTFTTPFEAGAPAIRKEIVAGIEQVINAIQKG